MVPALLSIALGAFLVSHAALVVSLARIKWWRGALALVVAPLAPYWGWGRGMKRRAIAWWAALVLYALGVALA